jgi:glycosyltransferase involved in cell wall biosynthesis
VPTLSVPQASVRGLSATYHRRVRVSVIIPTAFRPDLLLVALASVQAQRGTAWDVVVVDDGDGSGREAARSLGDPRVVAFMNPGRGQVDARSAGIDAAQGDAVVWLDDDDWLEDPVHLAAVAAALEDGPALVHRSGWVVDVDRDGHAERRRPFDLPADAASLRHDNTILTTGLGYPRSLHATVGPLDRTLGGYHDWDWYLRVVAAGVPLRHLPGLGVAYRIHAGNDSGRVTPERLTSFAAFRAKHALDIVMKHHVDVLEERSGPAAVTGVDAEAPVALVGAAVPLG